MLLIAYRHGLRAAELVDLRWEQIDFAAAMLHVRRVKRGTLATHPISGDELRALGRLKREQDPFVFTSERYAPFHTAGFARVVERAGAGGQARLQGAPTRYATPAAMRSPIRATTRASCRPTSGTSRYSTPFAVPS
jgi:integrase